MKKTLQHTALILLQVLLSAGLIAQPTITSFKPTSGPVGTMVTIHGSNFNDTATENIVYFGAVRAIVSEATTTSLIVTVPVGATYEPISVLNTETDLTAYSLHPFIVTFPGGGGNFKQTSFAGNLDFSTGTYPSGIVSGDLDGDGKSDLAVVNSSSHTVSVLLNTGTTPVVSFAAKVDLPLSMSPNAIAIGDLDGDGKLDLAMVGYPQTLSIFRNLSTPGNLSFEPQKELYVVGEYPTSIAIGDLTGDGKPDIAVADNNLASGLSLSTITTYHNSSTEGTIFFDVMRYFNVVDDGWYPSYVAIGDLDGDSMPDLAVTCWGDYDLGGDALIILRNTSIYGQISFAKAVTYDPGYDETSVAIGDLNADGRSDLIVTSEYYYEDGDYYGGLVSILKNMSTPGTISFIEEESHGTEFPSYGVNIGNLNGDAKPDLLVTFGAYYYPPVSVYKNTEKNGVISFAKEINYSAGDGTIDGCIGDFDGDGKPDISALNYYSATVSILRNLIGEVLPVSLLNFKAIKENNVVNLSWQTATENNTAYFNIQRSTDGITFTTRGKTDAVGNSTSLLSYTYTDNIQDITTNKLYYRLQVVDKDNSFTYSNIILVDIVAKAMFTISPNPAKNTVHVFGENLQQVQVFNVSGKQVINRNIKVTGDNTLNISSLAKGAYWVKMKDIRGNTQTEKLIVQ